MKNKHKLPFVAAALAFGLLIVAPKQAKADVISVFDLTGLLGQSLGIGELLSGTVTVDVATGAIVAQSLFGNPKIIVLAADLVQGYSATAQSYYSSFTNQINTYSQILFFDTTSLVNYSGGFLGSKDHPTTGGFISNTQGQLVPDLLLQYGAATLEVVYEPNSTGLLTLGVAGAAIIARVRKGKRQAFGDVGTTN